MQHVADHVVFAPDIYRNRVTDQFIRALWMRVTGSEEEVASDADSALAYFLSLDGVDREHVASMGFCFGGGQSLLLGLEAWQQTLAFLENNLRNGGP